MDLTRWTPQLAYVTGYFASDGCMEDRGYFFRVSFASVDEKLIKKTKRILKVKNEIKQQPPRGKGKQKTYHLSIFERDFYNFFASLGFTPRKSRTLQFPKIPKQFIPNFIKGYFDGDGSIYYDKKGYLRMDFSSCSKKFLEKLKQYIQNQNISCCGVYSWNNNNCHKIMLIGKNAEKFKKVINII